MTFNCLECTFGWFFTRLFSYPRMKRNRSNIDVNWPTFKPRKVNAEFSVRFKIPCLHVMKTLLFWTCARIWSRLEIYIDVIRSIEWILITEITEIVSMCVLYSISQWRKVWIFLEKKNKTKSLPLRINGMYEILINNNVLFFLSFWQLQQTYNLFCID